jgi:hypothetical protein
MERAMIGLEIDYTPVQEVVTLVETRSEQYLDAVKRAKDALVDDDLEMALKCIRAAQYVRYEMEEEVTDQVI